VIKGRNTKKTIERLLTIFNSLYSVNSKLEPYKPNKYKLYKLNLEKNGEWIEITQYLETSEMVAFLNSVIRLRAFFP
jgi:threonyl-tRNA synthetase